MGTKRVEGKIKRKSIKSAVTSLSNEKKRISRMGKKNKKGKMGPSADYFTRSAILRKLQITLKDFRRLCILKGIYPRVPEKALKGSDKIYYDVKDIAYLSHEPLLKKFREFKSFMKKIRREAGRNQFTEAKRKNELKPVINLNHLVKERYPRFIDALRDLEDCLCMVHLFASLPSVGRITSETTKICKELCNHWQFYIAKNKLLEKVFVSIKGIYYQVIIMGEPITWLVPHEFTQVIPKEIDIRVMMTFLDFYVVLLKFTLFKLFALNGLIYPPVVDKSLYSSGCGLLSFKVNKVDGDVTSNVDTHLLTNENSTTTNTNITTNNTNSNKIKNTLNKNKIDLINEKIDEIANNTLENEINDDDNDKNISNSLTTSFHNIFDNNDNNNEDSEDMIVFNKSTNEDDNTTINDKHKKLFNNFVFFINREISLQLMQLCIISFGGQVAWDGINSPYTVDNQIITHHVIDRPVSNSDFISNREYIQPQWIFDCINTKILLPIYKYKPGVVLPPHLSPFVDDNKEGYTPSYKQEIKTIKSSLEVQTSSHQTIEEENNNDDSSEDDNEEDSENDGEVLDEKVGDNQKVKTNNQIIEELDDNEIELNNNKDIESNEDSDNDDSTVEEATNDYSKKGPKGVVYNPAQPKQSEDEEAKQLSLQMMSKKTKRLYGRMQHGIKKKADFIETLTKKRKNHEDTENESKSNQFVDVKSPKVARLNKIKNKTKK